MAEALHALLGDPALREALGERNRAAIRPYGLESVRARMAELYEGELAGEGKR